MTDEPRPAEDDDEELGQEDEARLMRRYHLGAVAEASANMESVLRAIFSSLLGSPRATVVAAGQNVTWLATNALAVVDANDAVRAPSLGEPESVARFRAAIASCRDLYAQRNRLIHGVWVEGLPDGRPGYLSFVASGASPGHSRKRSSSRRSRSFRATWRPR